MKKKAASPIFVARLRLDIMLSGGNSAQATEIQSRARLEIERKELLSGWMVLSKQG